jgi:SapC
MMRGVLREPPVQISPPFGYSEIVPLQKARKVRLPGAGEIPEFCRKTNAVPISFSEFTVACRDYPLAFISTEDGRTYSPVAVLGVAGGENLFQREGRWDSAVYYPAYLRRYPFCMARVTLNSVEQADRLICVEKAFLSDTGERMFDDAGAPQARWLPIEKLLREYETDIEQAREMCAIFSDYALLEPFTVQVSLKSATTSFGGMYRVDEKRLEFLTAAQHRTLIRKGIMGRIYAHLMSLDNFARLVARKETMGTATQSGRA